MNRDLGVVLTAGMRIIRVSNRFPRGIVPPLSIVTYPMESAGSFRSPFLSWRSETWIRSALYPRKKFLKHTLCRIAWQDLTNNHPAMWHRDDKYTLVALWWVKRNGVWHLPQDFRRLVLYNDILYQNSVKNVSDCKKTEAGVALVWQDGKKEKSEVFSFSELDDMRINVQDLIEHPDLYRIDLQEHKIYQSQVGRNAY